MGARTYCSIILDRGANIEAKDSNGLTALLTAVGAARINVIQLLLARGANIEAKDNDGLTALLTAVSSGFVDSADLLIKHGANPYEKDKQGLNAFDYAQKDKTSSGKLMAILAQAAGTKDIWEAIMLNKIEAVQYWLDQGVDIESKTVYGSTPLIIASVRGQMAILDLLLDRGANIEATDNIGGTALIIAAKQGDLDVIRFLLDRGANMEAINDLGETALIIAAGEGNLDIIRFLLYRGANLEATNSTGATALAIAASEGNLDIIRLLLDKGANTEAKGWGDRTPLLMALLHPTLHMQDIVTLLINAGANPYAEDDLKGENAFDYAQRLDEPDDIIAILKTTKHIDPATIEEDTDTKKMIRRLGHIYRTMYPQKAEDRKEDEEKKHAAVPAENLLARGGDIPTRVHFNIFKNEIEQKYGDVLADPIAQQCIQKETGAYIRGMYVFYRSEPGQFRVYEYFLEAIDRLFKLFDKEVPFVWNRFFQDAALQQTINEYVDQLTNDPTIAQAHKKGAIFNQLLSANIPLFGNVRNGGSCTWNYLLHNYSAENIDLRPLFERIFDILGLNKKYIDDLMKLSQGPLAKYATLQQIMIPANIVDKVVMLSTHGYCFPWQEPVDEQKTCWNDNAISVRVLKHKKEIPQLKNGRHICIAPILDKYIRGRLEIDDAFQVRILMNAVYGLNPESIEIYTYTRAPEKKIQRLKQRVNKIVDQALREWLEKELKSAIVPKSALGTKLGETMKHIGKGSQLIEERREAARRKEEEQQEQRLEWLDRVIRWAKHLHEQSRQDKQFTPKDQENLRAIVMELDRIETVKMATDPQYILFVERLIQQATDVVTKARPDYHVQPPAREDVVAEEEERKEAA